MNQVRFDMSSEQRDGGVAVSAVRGALGPRCAVVLESGPLAAGRLALTCIDGGSVRTFGISRADAFSHLTLQAAS